MELRLNSLYENDSNVILRGTKRETDQEVATNTKNNANQDFNESIRKYWLALNKFEKADPELLAQHQAELEKSINLQSRVMFQEWSHSKISVFGQELKPSECEVRIKVWLNERVLADQEHIELCRDAAVEEQKKYQEETIKPIRKQVRVELQEKLNNFQASISFFNKLCSTQYIESEGRELNNPEEYRSVVNHALQGDNIGTQIKAVYDHFLEPALLGNLSQPLEISKAVASVVIVKKEDPERDLAVLSRVELYSNVGRTYDFYLHGWKKEYYRIRSIYREERDELEQILEGDSFADSELSVHERFLISQALKKNVSGLTNDFTLIELCQPRQWSRALCSAPLNDEWIGDKRELVKSILEGLEKTEEKSKSAGLMQRLKKLKAKQIDSDSDPEAVLKP